MNTNSNNVIDFYLCKFFKCGFALCHCEEGNSTIFKNWAPDFQCLPRCMRCHKYKEHLLHFSACIPSSPQQRVYTLAWFGFSGSMNECQCGSRWHTRKNDILGWCGQLDLKHWESGELWSLWCPQFMFCRVQVSWMMLKVMREWEMEPNRQCSPPMFTHDEILPLY